MFPCAKEDRAIPIQHRVALRLASVEPPAGTLDFSEPHDMDRAQELAGAYYRRGVSEGAGN